MGTQVALITGSARGIGLSSAIALAKHGFSIAVNGPNDDDELSNAVGVIENVGGKVYRVAFDICESKNHQHMLESIENELGPLTTLVNNAGVGVLNRGDLLDVTEESFDRCFDVNTKALFFFDTSVQ